jgi:alpha-beta hydrolase superfamily lysophospholipase
MKRIFPGLMILLTLLMTACQSVILLKPDHAALGRTEWVSEDGKAMPYKVWRPAGGNKVRGVVIAVHGLSGAASDFWLLGETLPKQGYIVYAYELRGQGNDPIRSNRGDIRSADEWTRDLATFHGLVQRQHRGRPVFWYGESLGSLICLHAAASDHGPKPKGLILASPVAGLRMTVSGFQRWMLETAAKLSPKSRFSLGDLAGVDEKKIQVTSTTTHGEQMAITPHHISQFSLRLLTEIGRLMDSNAGAAEETKMSTLFLATPNDILSSAEQVRTLFDQVSSRKKTLLWYTRSHHLLLHDVQRQEVCTDLLQWLEKHR